MRNFYFLVILFLITLSDKVLGINQGDLIKFHLKVQDVTVGEIPFGAANLFALIIENNGLDSVKLATSNVSPWMVYSGFWKVHIEGPVDERCKKYISYSVDELGIGEVPCIEIPRKGKREFQLSLVGVGGAGVYKVWVEYDGRKVPWDECFHGVIRSPEYTFQIKEPEGVDKEIFDLWQRQNPESPPCLFPMNMEPNISDKEVLLEKYPTSTYAGWVLINEGYYYIRPENWQNIKISAYIKESLYKNDRSVESMKEYAGERIEKLKEYLKERPDFALSDWMRFEISFWNAYQGNYKQAKEEAESLIKVSKDERAKTKAEELLKCLRENNFIK